MGKGVKAVKKEGWKVLDEDWNRFLGRVGERDEIREVVGEVKLKLKTASCS